MILASMIFAAAFVLAPVHVHAQGPTAPLTGTVTIDGAPFAGATVVIGTNLSGPQAVTDADGTYRIDVLIGMYSRLEVHRALGDAESIRVIKTFPRHSFESEETFDVAIPGAFAPVHVQDAVGKPIKNVRLVARPRLVCQTAPFVSTCTVMSGAKNSDANGDATFRLVDPIIENQEILAYPSPDSIFAPTFVTGKTAYTVTLPYAKTVTGHVTHDGSPAEALVVAAANVILPMTTTSDAAGAYRLKVPVGMRSHLFEARADMTPPTAVALPGPLRIFFTDTVLDLILP